MVARWEPVEQDSKRNIKVLLHPTATPLQMVTGSHADEFDLTPYVKSCSHSHNEANVTLSWHHEFYVEGQPGPDMIIELRLDDQLLWWGIIESVNNYQLSSGVRAATLTARTRDASPKWRNVRRVSEVYPVATPLSIIARDIAYALGMTADEVDIDDTSVYTVHSSVQLADMTAWEMLEKLAHPVGVEPFINAKGQLKIISRDITRQSDIILSKERILSVNGSRARPSLTGVRLRWLDPNYTLVYQQDQVLGEAAITAGFFRPNQNKHVYFSQDRRQEATETRLVIKQSCNLYGWLEPFTESYRQETQRHGNINILLPSWWYGLLAAITGGILATSEIPDGVAGSETVPIGRVIHGTLLTSILVLLSSVGTGVYEVWGRPYDYVHARNTTEAYDESAPEWLDNIQEIENDFIMNEAMAQAYAVRELVYGVRSASSYNVSIVDDPRIEPGDILQLPDDTRIYVTGYKRDLSPGAGAVLSVEGFPA